MFGSSEGSRDGLSSPSRNKVGITVLKELWRCLEWASISRKFLRVTTNAEEQLTNMRWSSFTGAFWSNFSFRGYLPCKSSDHRVLGIPRWHHGQLKHVVRQQWCHLHLLGVISDKESELSGKKNALQGAQRIMLWWLLPWSTCTASCFALIVSPWAFRDAKVPTQR